MFENKEGQKVPNTTFHIRVDDLWQAVATDALFANKTVIVFALPGAFTPTCSSAHLPRYNELADAFKANGIDDILCVSVNDTFVMNAWRDDQNASKITFIPDGNGEFTEGMGMLIPKDDLGFGKRSWRYSMLVKNGVITKMFIEPQEPGDPFKVSDADTMLNYIAPDYKLPHPVSIFTKAGCPFCAKAKQLLQEYKISYEEIVLNKDITTASVRAISAQSTVPQIFIGGQHIGGGEALEAYLSNEPGSV